jgi:hypothetical protein
MQAMKACSPVAFEPAQHRGLTLVHHGGDLVHRQALFHCEPDHLSPGPPPRWFGGAIEVIACLGWHGCQRWELKWSHASSIPSGINTFVVVLRGEVDAMRPLQWTPLSQEELAVLHGLYRTTKDVRIRTRAQLQPAPIFRQTSTG